MTVPSRMAGLTWSFIKSQALTSEIRFHFGLSIDLIYRRRIRLK